MKKTIRMFSILLFVICLLTTTIAFAGEKVYFYHTDPSGTPIAMSDQSGNIVWRADYKPFGEEQTVTGNIENNEKFVGKEKDKETGLYYFGARYLKDKIGRFIAPDPVWPVNTWNSKTNYELLVNPQRLNLYAYGLNNPYRYVDKDGNWALVIEYDKNAQYGSLALVWNGLLPDGVYQMKTRADKTRTNAAVKSGLYDYKLGKHKGSYFPEHDALIINNNNEISVRA